MKKYYLLISLFSLLSLAIHSESQAQTLQFKQVKLLQLVAPASDTVPPGHTWKVEQIGVNSNSKGAWSIALNGNIYGLYSQVSANSAGYHAYSGPTGPLWLPEGTVIQGVTTSLTYQFSIIEFEIIP